MDLASSVGQIIDEIARKHSLKVDLQKGLFSTGQFNSLLAVELILALESRFGANTKSAITSIVDLDNIENICRKLQAPR